MKRKIYSKLAEWILIAKLIIIHDLGVNIVNHAFIFFKKNIR